MAKGALRQGTPERYSSGLRDFHSTVMQKVGPVMQDCPCGGDLKWLTSKGIDYRQCKSCGRNDYPERVKQAELVVVKGDSP